MDEPCPSLPLQPPGQARLFSSEQLEDTGAIATAAKQCLHTGKIVTRNEERAAFIVEQYLANGSLLATARVCRCSPNTVKAVVDVYAAAGKLDDLKQRVSAKLGLLAELSLDGAIESVLKGKTQASVLPINIGVALDKKALLDGDPTERVERIETHQVDLTAALDYLRSKGVPVAIDVQSTVLPAIPASSETIPATSDTPSDTSPP